MTTTLQGKCLLASPYLEDGNFYRSVVLILRHTDEDAFGVILNRPTDYTLEQVVSMVCDKQCVHDGVLHCGGPVDGPLVAIHDQDNLGGIECAEGLYLSTDQGQLLELFERKNAKLKLFDGFAGWGPGQLESEMQDGGWLVSDIDPTEAMEENEELWNEMVRRLGHNILTSDGKLSMPNVDPQWN